MAGHHTPGVCRVCLRVSHQQGVGTTVVLSSRQSKTAQSKTGSRTYTFQSMKTSSSNSCPNTTPPPAVGSSEGSVRAGLRFRDAPTSGAAPSWGRPLVPLLSSTRTLHSPGSLQGASPYPLTLLTTASLPPSRRLDLRSELGFHHWTLTSPSEGSMESPTQRSPRSMPPRP